MISKYKVLCIKNIHIYEEIPVDGNQFIVGGCGGSICQFSKGKSFAPAIRLISAGYPTNFG